MIECVYIDDGIKVTNMTYKCAREYRMRRELVMWMLVDYCKCDCVNEMDFEYVNRMEHDYKWVYQVHKLR